ncbi:isochorismate synthase [Pelagicoccus sp. SDUM812003]|uniref:isochorismate synthase n=1 Tax=Pelagicoccus sp. SDUM812003 TaxID=3041267 RepID=UPI00280FF124|nr:isochorismate synthase [Pelagicoccus sp. SDUM812003]MDQ8203684.1 isochorismate synthase [Pelagicoccus sp. SDUM812003]
MDTIPLDPSQAGSYEALFRFLQGCQARAAERSHPQLVSIAAEAGALDPLAVLESIYEENEPHFYTERRSENLAIAGAEDAVRFAPTGPRRFAEVKEWIADTLEHTIAVGDDSLPFFGPCFFSAFSFFADVEQSEPFPSSSVFVPRWQVAVKKGRCVAIANALVEPESDVAAEATRIWNANTKFRSFDYADSEQRRARPRLDVIETSECGGDAIFKQSVSKAVEAIKRGDFRKIVLARALDLTANQAFHPLEILNTLRERYPDCYAFSYANGRGESFIGASPERLVSVEDAVVKVDALAGTAPRGRSASEDAQLGNQLLHSEKDLREHAIVFESIRRRLQQLGISAPESCRPYLKKLQNVQHLHVDIEAKKRSGIHMLDIVEALHPTPAVGGTPREVAVASIRDFETFPRGLYAGPIGWVNAQGEGEFLVAIRSAQVSGKQARLYAGVGVVDGSEPEREYQETNLKFQALKENLL